MTELTEHFSLEEFIDSQTATRRGVSNMPAGKELKNVHRAAETMEKVREILDDKPILISSGYRSPWLNAAVGGSKNSAHTHGLAIDFTCPGFGAPLAICQKLGPHLVELQIDQLIYEYKTWVHLGLVGPGFDARHETLTIDKHGVRHGFG